MKNKLIKGVILGLALGVTIVSPNFATNEYVYAKNAPSYSYVNTLRGHSQVTITDTKLRNALYSLLGKSTGEQFFTDDFVLHNDYKAVEIPITPPDTENKENSGSNENTNGNDDSSGTGDSSNTENTEGNGDTEETEVPTVLRANKSCIDLSYTGVTNIIELCQFEFPETLVAINLMGNGITNVELSTILQFSNLTTTQKTIEYNGIKYTIASNFDTIIKKINLNLNNLDLNTVDQDALDNTKILYGLQNVYIQDSNLYTIEDIKDAKYYIRSDDINYLSYTATYNTNRYSLTEDHITPLIKTTNDLSSFTGEYDIIISNPPSSSTGYFYGLNKQISLNVFNIKIRDDFVAERTRPFSITTSDLVVSGLYENIKYRFYDNVYTGRIGTSYAQLDIEYKNKTKTIIIPFLVIDTQKPVITLNGYDVIYWRQFKNFIDPGYSANDSGDDISAFVTTNPEVVDITKIGEYTIEYNVSDESGNHAVTKYRKVIVQESVLDSIILKTAKTDYSVGEELTITVKPDDNTPISKYSNFKYYWYVNGTLFKTTTGDNISGQSTLTYIPNSSNEQIITVTLHAKQIEDDREISVDSAELIIKAKVTIGDNITIIIASALAIVLIIGVIVVVMIIKRKKAKGRIQKKQNRKSKNKNTQSQPEIQVIRNYIDNDNNK